MRRLSEQSPASAAVAPAWQQSLPIVTARERAKFQHRRALGFSGAVAELRGLRVLLSACLGFTW